KANASWGVRWGEGVVCASRCGARGSRVRAVPSDDPRRLVAAAVRSAPRRGRAAAGRAGQPVHRRARSARRRCEGDRSARNRSARPPSDRPRPLPVVDGQPAGGGIRPVPDTDSGRSGRALHGRRRRDRPRRAQRASGPRRLGAVRRYRRPWGEPARVQLAARVPRLRPPSGTVGTHRARPSRAAAGRARRAYSGAGPAGPAPRPVARLWPHPRRRRARAPARRTTSAHTAHRTECAHARGEPRLALPGGLPLGDRGLRAARRPASGRGARARGMAVATDTLERAVLAALAEDIGAGDVTTEATVPENALGTAELLVKEPGVVCGLRAAESTFRALDPEVRFEALASDGDLVG